MSNQGLFSIINIPIVVMKLKTCLIPPSANNFEHPIPCICPAAHLRPVFLEDLVPPSKLVMSYPPSANNFENPMLYSRPCHARPVFQNTLFYSCLRNTCKR